MLNGDAVEKKEAASLSYWLERKTKGGGCRGTAKGNAGAQTLENRSRLIRRIA